MSPVPVPGGVVFGAPSPPTPLPPWGPGFPPCFQEARLPGVRGPCGQAFRRLSGAFRRPCFPVARIRPASRGPGIFELFFFAASAPFVFVSQSPGFHAFRRPGFPKASSMLSGDRGPGARARASLGFFQDMILSLHLLFLADCINIHIFRI